MMRFFNDDTDPNAWHPPSFPNHDPERVAVPVGQPCLYCEVLFKEGDCGLFMIHMGETVEEKPWHIQCLRKSLGIEGASA